MTRRTFLQGLATASAALSFVGSNRADETPKLPSRFPYAKPTPLKLGVASISLRDLPVPAAVAVLQQLDIAYVSPFGTHVSFEKDTPEKCAAVTKIFRDGGIAITTSSVVNLPNEENAVARAFANARAGGLTLMVCKPARDAFPLLERFVRSTGIRLAVHNHGPEDALYPSPNDVLKAIAPYDARIGLCLDIGHAMRAGADSAKVVHEAGTRLFDVHLKDSLALPGSKQDIPIEVGRGDVDIRGILTALVNAKYAGVASFEYERVGTNPTTGLAESVGYVRGVLGSIKA